VASSSSRVTASRSPSGTCEPAAGKRVSPSAGGGYEPRRVAAAVLDWWALAGVTALLDEPGRAAAPAASDPVAAPTTASRPAAPRQGGERAGGARAIADAAGSLDALRAALEVFDGCPLKQTATRLCFADGVPEARLMLIGEAPGAEEDRQGLPFVGPSGQLLDRMLAAVGLDRTQVWITNAIFWRPPGNRPPSGTEIAICQPFLERQIELLGPALIMFAGGLAARALLGIEEGVTKARGRGFAYTTRDGRIIPARVMFHPAYLLRQPLQKRFAWRDLLQARAELDRLTAAV